MCNLLSLSGGISYFTRIDLRMSQPINQHWVPKFYLRYFATPESCQTTEPQVWIFSKDEEDGDETLTNIRNICARRYLYSPEDKAGKRNWTLETRLQQLESTFSGFWEHLANGFIELSNDSIRKGVALFASIMYLRHPDNLKELPNIHQNMVRLFEQAAKRTDGTPDVDSIEIDGELHKIDTSGWHEYCSWGKREHHQFFTNFVHSEATHLANLLIKKRWSVVFTETPQFITSDKPVTKQHATKETFGFGTKGAIVSFPLSQTRLLVMDDMHNEPANQYYPLKEGNLGAFNYSIWRNGSRFMVSGRPIEQVLREIVAWTDAYGAGTV